MDGAECALLTGGNPGRGGMPGLGGNPGRPLEGPLPLPLPPSFLNFVFNWK